MSAGRYALGVASLLLVWAPILFTAVVLRTRWLPALTGATARLAEAVIGLGLLLALLEVLGSIGLFRLGPIVAACVLAGLAGLAVHSRADRGPGGSGEDQIAPSSRASPAIALLAGTALIAAWAGLSLSSYEFGIRGFDSLWYHLPWAASFAQTGHITPLRFTDVEYLAPFYPASAELLHGVGIALLGRDTLSPGLNLVWLGLLLLAAYCVGRPRGLGHATLLGTAIVMATPAMTLSQAGSAANDVVGVFFLLAAVALLPRATEDRAALALAGLAAGLAIATKLSLLGPVLALTVGVIVLAPPGGRRAVTLAWVTPLALAGGFWYLRNLIAVGNPLPWVSIPGLATPAPALQQHTGFSLAHYATDTHVWTAFFGPGLRSGLGDLWPAVVLAALLGPVLCLLRGAGRRLQMLGLVALASVLGYLLTPESAAGPPGDPIGFAFNLRYAAPPLVLGLTLLPLAPALSRTPRARQATVAGLGLLLVATLADGRLWPSRQLLGAIAIAVGFLILAVAIVRGPPAVGRLPVVAALLVLLLAGVAAGYPWQRRYLRGRYAFQPGVSDLAHVWAYFRGVHHARVAVVGTFGGFFSYPLFGLDDSNRVQYVGRRGPHGSFTTITSCPDWRAALNAGRFQYVVTTPARDPWHPKRLGPSPEAGWTGSDPAARLVYARRAEGQPVAVYLLRGALDPGSCPTG